MTVSNGHLSFSSEGPKGRLFQVNLGSSAIYCLVTASEECQVHGIAAFKEGIAFSDPKAHQIKLFSSSAGISVVAGDGKEGRGKGGAEFANFMQPTGLCSGFDCNLLVCHSQLGEISLVTGVQGT